MTEWQNSSTCFQEVSRDRVVKRDISKHAKPKQPTVSMSEEEMVQHLSQTGRYRILSKLVPREIAPFQRPEYPLKGIILDTETTGLNAHKELRYLRAEIYRYPDADPPIKRLTAFDRFRA